MTTQRPLKIERSQDGKIVRVIVEERTPSWLPYLGRETVQQREYEGRWRIASWEWLEMPHRTIVGDRMSFQLDAWAKYHHAD